MSADGPRAPLPELPADVLAQLGLPESWRPVPIVWHFAHLKSARPAAAPNASILLIDGPHGRAGFMFTDDELRALIDRITEVTTGLTVARTIDTNGGGNGRPRL